MQRCAAFKVVFRCGFIVGPVYVSCALERQHKSVECRGSVWRGCGAKSATGPSYICFPPKMSRCWTGGMPSFSSTRSFIRETWGCQFVVDGFGLGAHLVIGLDVELDLLAGEGADPALLAMNRMWIAITYLINILGGLELELCGL